MKTNNILTIVIGIGVLAGGGYAIYHFGFKDKKSTAETKEVEIPKEVEQKKEEKQVTETPVNTKAEPSMLLNKNLATPIKQVKRATFNFSNL